MTNCCKELREALEQSNELIKAGVLAKIFGKRPITRKFEKAINDTIDKSNAALKAPCQCEESDLLALRKEAADAKEAYKRCNKHNLELKDKAWELEKIRDCQGELIDMLRAELWAATEVVERSRSVLEDLRSQDVHIDLGALKAALRNYDATVSGQAVGSSESPSSEGKGEE